MVFAHDTELALAAAAALVNTARGEPDELTTGDAAGRVRPYLAVDRRSW